MTQQTFSKKVLRPRIAKVLVGKYDLERILAQHGISCLQLEIDIAAAIRPLFSEDGTPKAEQSDGFIFDYLAEQARHDSKLSQLLAMRERIESALKKNIYDWERGKWAGFDRWLLRRPEYETIEGFMKWWRQDDFRKKNEVYLDAAKIKENWLRVYPKKKQAIKAEPMKGGYR